MKSILKIDHLPFFINYHNLSFNYCWLATLRIFLYGAIALFLWGCVAQGVIGADAGGKASEVEWGGGVSAAIGKPLPSGKTSIYGFGSYHYYTFTGGHDNLLQLGIQARQNLNLLAERFWIGGLAAWVYDASVFDDDYYSVNPSANGFSIGTLGGYRIPLEAININVFSGLTLIKFGDFKSNSTIVEPAHTSLQFRIGAELEIPFHE